MSVPDTPARLDRVALDRVLQRAAELQLGEAELGEGLSEQEILDLGRQVGIPARYVHQAMLEERSRVSFSRPATMLDRWVGPAEVGAQRVIQGSRDGVEAALLQWMEKHELLTIQRQQPGRITWERLGGMQAALRRGASVFTAGTARFMLAKAGEVSATITALEAGYCHVALTATLRQERSGLIGGAAAVASMGGAGTAVLGALGAMVAITVLPVLGGVAGGFMVSRLYAPRAARVQLGLERVLDFVERGAVKPAHELPSRPAGMLELLGGEIRKALGSGGGGSRPDRGPRP